MTRRDSQQHISFGWSLAIPELSGLFFFLAWRFFLPASVLHPRVGFPTASSAAWDVPFGGAAARAAPCCCVLALFVVAGHMMRPRIGRKLRLVEGIWLRPRQPTCIAPRPMKMRRASNGNEGENIRRGEDSSQRVACLLLMCLSQVDGSAECSQSPPCGQRGSVRQKRTETDRQRQRQTDRQTQTDRQILGSTGMRRGWSRMGWREGEGEEREEEGGGQEGVQGREGSLVLSWLVRGVLARDTSVWRRCSPTRHFVNRTLSTRSAKQSQCFFCKKYSYTFIPANTYTNMLVQFSRQLWRGLFGTSRDQSGDCLPLKMFQNF